MAGTDGQRTSANDRLDRQWVAGSGGGTRPHRVLDAADGPACFAHPRGRG
ncbi:hypothetical protein [Streptomyces flaveolus]